jgi:hypothetical protein
MKSSVRHSLLVVALMVYVIGTDADGQSRRLPGQGIQDTLFHLSERDLHLHSVMERPVDLKTWLDQGPAMDAGW